MAFGGNSINAVLLNGTQTIFGTKTFNTTPKFPTQSSGTKNTTGATTLFVSNAITDAIADNCVTLTDSQIVGGVKTFTSALNLESNGPRVNLRHTKFTKGTAPESECYEFLNFVDNSDNRVGNIQYTCSSGLTSSVIVRAEQINSTTGTGSAGVVVSYTSNNTRTVNPYEDNNTSLGIASKRWQQLFAGTATINTSDEREKQQIADVPENVLDAWADVNFCQFKFNDSVAEKGDAARLHTGLIAQRIKSVFEAHGLDAAAYGLFCHDSWAQSEDVPAGDRYALRYEECLTLEAAFQRRRADRIEKRLEALEKALNND